MNFENPITVIIADDHDLILEGLQTLLRSETDIQLIAIAKDGDLLIEHCLRYQPDVVVTDIKMPVLDGITATRYVTENNPNIKVLCLSVLDNEFAVIEMLEAGALGYLVKSASKEEITTAIRSVHSGIPYYCESTTPLLQKLISESKFDPYKNKKLDILDQREKDIIKLMCQEKINQEIANELFLSIRTVQWYRLNIYKKIGVPVSLCPEEIS